MYYISINIVTFSYAHLVGKENKENRRKEVKWPKYVPRVSMSRPWGSIIFCVVQQFFFNAKVNLFTPYTMTNDSLHSY